MPMMGDPLAFLRQHRKFFPDPLEEQVPIPQEVDPLEELYSEGPNMRAFEEHISNVPQRKPAASTDRVLAALSSALDDRPHDRFGRITDMLDRPYNQEVEDYKLKGSGLQTAAQMEERKQGKKLAYNQHKSSLEERKRAELERATDRDEERKARYADAQAKLEQRIAEAKQRAEDQAANREDRAQANKDRIDLQRQMLALRRDQMNDRKAEKKDNPNYQLFDSEGEKFIFDKNTKAVEPLNMSTKDSDKSRDTKTNVLSLYNELKQLDSAFDKAPGYVKGPYMGPAVDWASRNAPFNLGANIEGQDMRTLAKRIKSEYLTATGGKSLTKTEIQLLEPSLPKPEQPDHMFKTNMKHFLTKMEHILQNRYGMKPEEYGGVSPVDENDPLGIN